MEIIFGKEKMSFYFEVLPKDADRTISAIKNLPFLKNFYLAGGTAAALYLGHRISADLDFFTKQPFNESLFISKIAKLGKFQLEKKSEQTVISILDHTKVSFFGYNYPLLLPLKKMNGINIAHIIDIACMKIDAISSRGTKRDFVDIYFIAKEIMPLPKILKFFKKKYRTIGYNMMHVRKSLVYFTDAEKEPMPKMLKSADWKVIKSFFQTEVKRF